MPMTLQEQAAYNREMAVYYIECASMASERTYARTYMFLAQVYVGLAQMITTGLKAGDTS